MADTTTAHAAWCAREHDDDTNSCLSPTVRFARLGVAAWIGQTEDGPRVVVDASGPIEATPDDIAALAAFLTTFVAPAVSPRPAGGDRC